MRQSWPQILVEQQGLGTTLTNTTTPTSIIRPEARVILPASFFTSLGDVLSFHVAGALGNLVTTPGTLTLQFLFGAIVVFDTGAINMTSTAHTTKPFSLDVRMRMSGTGASTNAKFISRGWLMGSQFAKAGATAESTVTDSVIMVPVTTPADGNGFDQTAAQQIDLQATFSVASASNTIQTTQFSLCSWN